MNDQRMYELKKEYIQFLIDELEERGYSSIDVFAEEHKLTDEETVALLNLPVIVREIED